MSQYKVGDVAALFSKPKEPTTESGKKLQSLFKEFQSKNKKGSSQITEKSVNNLNEGREKAQNQRLSRSERKRKLAITSEESDEVQRNIINTKNLIQSMINDTKKFKKEKNEVTNSTELNGKHFPAELNNNTKKFKKAKNEATNSTELKEKHFPAEVYNNRKKFKKAKNEATTSIELKEHFPANVNNNTKKFKKAKNESTSSTELKGKHFPAELDFPRKKKSKASKNNLKNNTFNSFAEDEDALSDDIKQAPGDGFKSKMKSNDKKQISNFIRMSKQQRQAAINGAIKSKDSENVSDKDKYRNGTLFKEDSNEEFVKQNAKKQKKKKHTTDNFVQNKKSKDTGGNENKTLLKKSYGDNKQFSQPIMSGKGEPDFIKIPDSTSEDEEEKLSHTLLFKKSYGDNKQISQPIISGKGEPDFIRIPDLKSGDKEEKLSRTLFVANLPVTIKRKALTTLFSPFGEIENIRCHGVETDKAKIFNEKGRQTLNPKNYAADSIPAFITFCARESAVKALSLSGSLFKGRHITVDFALPAGTKKMYDNKRSIFIGNLSFDCQDESIWEAFSECGRIESVRIVRDKQTGIGKGFGYVLFSTVQSKENALGLEDLEIQGRTIRIKAVDSNPSKQRKSGSQYPAKIDTFKSRAIKIKMKNKDSTSRKSVKKIMKKQKNLHNKKKIANILRKSMKL